MAVIWQRMVLSMKLGCLLACEVWLGAVFDGILMWFLNTICNRTNFSSVVRGRQLTFVLVQTVEPANSDTAYWVAQWSLCRYKQWYFLIFMVVCQMILKFNLCFSYFPWMCQVVKVGRMMEADIAESKSSRACWLHSCIMIGWGCDWRCKIFSIFPFVMASHAQRHADNCLLHTILKICYEG